MRSGLYTVCQLLAIHRRTGDTPAGAVDRLVRRSHGEVIGELAAASAQVRASGTAAMAFEQLTATTPEPSAARLYRLLATRLHLPEWERGIQRKLEVLEGIYEVISDHAAHFRSELLEVLVVLLIVTEIIISLIKH